MLPFLMEIKDTLSFIMGSNLINFVELKVPHENTSLTIKRVSRRHNFQFETNTEASKVS